MELGVFENLPTEDICGIIEKLGVEELGRLMATSSRVRDVAQHCITALNLGQRTVPASFVLSFPYLTRVQGKIQVANIDEVPLLSRQIRGSLALIIHTTYESLVAENTELSNLSFRTQFQNISLELLLVRGVLYPHSFSLEEMVIQRTDRKTTRSFLISYDADTQALILNLLVPETDESRKVPPNFYSDTVYSPKITRLFRDLPIRSLDLSVVTSGYGRVVHLSPEAMKALASLELQEFTANSGDMYPLGEYVGNRLRQGLPLTLSRLRFVRSVERETYTGTFTLTSVFSGKSLPSVTEISGVKLSPIPDSFRTRFAAIFPNLRLLRYVDSEAEVPKWKETLPTVKFYRDDS